MTKFRAIIILLSQVVNLSLVSTECILIDDCPVAKKYIAKRLNDPETRRIFFSVHCQLVIAGVLLHGVHCDQIPDFQNSQGKSKTDLLPKGDECGIQAPASKIIRGQRTNFEDFPWLALFQYKNKTNHVEYRCHGTLISSRYVVTAAHCLFYTAASRDKIGTIYKVILGEYDTTSPLDCHPPIYGGYCANPIQEISPESTHVHPDFGTSGAISDIGLVRLQKAATFSDFVKPICLPLEPTNVQPYDSMLIAGWGKTETRKLSNVKLQAKIYYLTKRECSQFDVDFTQICAGSKTGADTCKGDSGGPLIVNRLSQNREPRSILMGVVSYGGRCGAGSAIYTNVTTFVKWILDTIHE